MFYTSTLSKYFSNSIIISIQTSPSVFTNRAGSGSALYGGLLDRCNLSKLTPLTFGGLNSSSLFFSNISNISGQLQDSITSDPVRVCFCRDGQPDCSYQHPAITNISKGEKFEISVVAVDHVNRSVDAEINSSRT